MTTLKVPEMHCNMCVTRITKAMTAAGLKFAVDLPSKTVSVEGGDQEIAQTREILDDLGFSAEA